MMLTMMMVMNSVAWTLLFIFNPIICIFSEANLTTTGKENGIVNKSMLQLRCKCSLSLSLASTLYSKLDLSLKRIQNERVFLQTMMHSPHIHFYCLWMVQINCNYMYLPILKQNKSLLTKEQRHFFRFSNSNSFIWLGCNGKWPQ